MNILRACVLAIAATTPAIAEDDGATRSSSTTTITILHTNDIHGRHAPFQAAPGDATSQTGDPGRSPAQFDHAGKVGGFQYLAGKVGEIRKREGKDNVLLLDAGDTFSDDFVGNKTRGEAVISLMNALGYDMMALGNHDFDYGVERTRELQELANFPIRGANVTENGEPVFGQPWRIFEVDGVKIAVLALTYHSTDKTASAQNIRGLTYSSGIEATQRYLPEMRRAADIVMLLSHQGTATDRKLARELDGVDVIVGGHSHDLFRQPERVGGTWIVQAMADAAVLGELRLDVGPDKKLRRVTGAAHQLWNYQIEPDPEIAELVARIDGPFGDELNEVLAYSVDRIPRDYRSESAFDKMVGEFMIEETGADVALMPGVGYGISIYPGEVTRDRLYTLIPHPAKLVTFEMRGRDLLAVLEQSATNQNPGDPMQIVGGLIQPANLGWTVDLNRPKGDRVSEVTVGNQPIEADRWYKVATNAGMSNGLHRYDFTGVRNKQVHDRSVTQLVEDVMKRKRVLSRPASGSTRLVKVFDPKN